MFLMTLNRLRMDLQRILVAYMIHSLILILKYITFAINVCNNFNVDYNTENDIIAAAPNLKKEMTSAA